MKNIRRLKNLDFTSSKPDDVREILSNVGFLPISCVLKAGTIIVRTRDKEGCFKRSEMTYCSKEKAEDDFQRASLGYKPMFYGVISDDKFSIEKAEAISIAESSKLCRQGKFSIGIEKFSVSYWEVNKPLKVAAFITDETFLNVQDNVLLNILRDSFKEKCKDTDICQNDIDLARFISSEYSKKVNDKREYLISATISDIIINDFGYDGVIFPSVPFMGQAGLNIAIPPNIVDDSLFFIGTSQNVLYKNKNKSIIRKENKNMVEFPDFVIEKELGIDSISSLLI